MISFIACIYPYSPKLAECRKVQPGGSGRALWRSRGGVEPFRYFHYKYSVARQKAVFLGGAAHFPKRQN